MTPRIRTLRLIWTCQVTELVRYELVPFRVNGVNIVAEILRGKPIIMGELKEEGGWLGC